MTKLNFENYEDCVNFRVEFKFTQKKNENFKSDVESIKSIDHKLLKFN